VWLDRAWLGLSHLLFGLIEIAPGDLTWHA
jgi:hypothetical protein